MGAEPVNLADWLITAWYEEEGTIAANINRQVLDEIFRYESVIDNEFACCHSANEIRVGQCQATPVNEITALQLWASAYPRRPGYKEWGDGQ